MHVLIMWVTVYKSCISIKGLHAVKVQETWSPKYSFVDMLLLTLRFKLKVWFCKTWLVCFLELEPTRFGGKVVLTLVALHFLIF